MEQIFLTGYPREENQTENHCGNKHTAVLIHTIICLACLLLSEHVKWQFLCNAVTTYTTCRWLYLFLDRKLGVNYCFIFIFSFEKFHLIYSVVNTRHVYLHLYLGL